MFFGNEGSEFEEQDTYIDTEEEFDDTSTCRDTIRRQKEKDKENKKEKQKIASQPCIEDTPGWYLS